MRRSGFKGLVAAGLVAAGVAASTTVVAASDMFLKLGLIQGESLDKVHKNEMDVLAWSWGMSTGEARTKKGLLPTTCVQDLELTKYIDKATPDLIMMGLTGEVQPLGILTVRRNAGELQPNDYLTLTLTNVSVLSYETGGSGGEDRLTETLVLHFDSLKGDYKPMDVKGGPGTAVSFTVSGACP
jgi:type VI secretion system secreted protein Hcp